MDAGRASKQTNWRRASIWQWPTTTGRASPRFSGIGMGRSMWPAYFPDSSRRRLWVCLLDEVRACVALGARRPNPHKSADQDGDGENSHGLAQGEEVGQCADHEWRQRVAEQMNGED